LVQLNARNNAALGDGARDKSAANLPANRLVKQDRSADVFAQSGNREQRPSVGVTVAPRERNIESLESTTEGGHAPIRGRKSFAGRREGCDLRFHCQRAYPGHFPVWPIRIL